MDAAGTKKLPALTCGQFFMEGWADDNESALQGDGVRFR